MVNFQALQKKANEPSRLLICRCDVSKADDIHALMDFVKKNTEGIDVLVNNAGMLPVGTVTGDLLVSKNFFFSVGI